MSISFSREPNEYSGVDLSRMTAKRKAFCREYLADGRSTIAAERAGYHPISSTRLLKEPEIKAYCDWLHDSMRTEKIASATEIQERLTAILRGELVEQVALPNGQVIEKSADIRDILKALEQMGKRYGIYQDKVQHTLVDFTISVEDEEGLED